MPLIRNPAFQPPKLVSLNTNYAKLLATLPGSVIPPKVSVQRQHLESWIAELDLLKQDNLDSEWRRQQSDVYTHWLKDLQRKVAPGFDFDAMTPLNAGHTQVKSEPEEKNPARPFSPTSGLREDLDNLTLT